MTNEIYHDDIETTRILVWKIAINAGNNGWLPAKSFDPRVTWYDRQCARAPARVFTLADKRDTATYSRHLLQLALKSRNFGPNEQIHERHKNKQNTERVALVGGHTIAHHIVHYQSAFKWRLNDHRFEWVFTFCQFDVVVVVIYCLFCRLLLLLLCFCQYAINIFVMNGVPALMTCVAMHFGQNVLRLNPTID